MAKAELKTKKTKKNVMSFLKSIENETRRKDAITVLEIMKEITGEKPALWGEKIVGFGDWHYKYATGREGDYFIIGFSPAKQHTTIYIMPGYQDFSEELKKLGPYKKGAACLYIKKLEDIHLPTLKKMIRKGYKMMKK